MSNTQDNQDILVHTEETFALSPSTARSKEKLIHRSHVHADGGCAGIGQDRYQRARGGVQGDIAIFSAGNDIADFLKQTSTPGAMGADAPV